jgi:hypothetical protein
MTRKRCQILHDANLHEYAAARTTNCCSPQRVSCAYGVGAVLHHTWERRVKVCIMQDLAPYTLHHTWERRVKVCIMQDLAPYTALAFFHFACSLAER